MPVIDHPVHPKTVQGSDFRYRCHGRPAKFKPYYWAMQRRFFSDGSFDFISVRVPFRMSHECHSDGANGLGKADPGCTGCPRLEDRK